MSYGFNMNLLFVFLFNDIERSFSSDQNTSQDLQNVKKTTCFYLFLKTMTDVVVFHQLAHNLSSSILFFVYMAMLTDCWLRVDWGNEVLDECIVEGKRMLCNIPLTWRPREMSLLKITHRKEIWQNNDQVNQRSAWITGIMILTEESFFPWF